MDDSTTGTGPMLDLDEAIRLLGGETTWRTHGAPTLGLEPIVLADGPHGVRRTTRDAPIIDAFPATCFPPAAGLAATWDPELLAEVGTAMGREARTQGVSVVLGPGANIKRHPLGGRNFEYFSEDPLLSGELAAAMIRGIQRTGVGASLKHFVANNQETRRMTVDVIVDERALREIYLAGFERAVRLGRPWTVMCAYNRVNGTYCSDHRGLMTDLLRGEWGFDGVVVTDWGAMNDRVAGVRAGVDLEMPGSGSSNVREVRRALDRDELDRYDFDDAVARVLDLLERTAPSTDRRAVEHPGPLDAGMIDEHHELARRAAAAATVLLTNDGVLPLEPTGTIAVVGGFATDPRYQGAGSSQVAPTRLDGLLDAMRRRASADLRVVHAAGYDPHSDDTRDDLLDEAVLVTRAADVAVVIVGLPDTYESEGFDREHLRLPDQHNRLVRAICDVNPNTVVVLANGAPVQLPWIDRPRATLEAYLGGQGGGEGLARVILGEAEPGGRLAETFPLRAADHGADAWFPGEGRQVQYRESIHVGYRWFDTVDAPVLFPFGHGLGYTTFEYGTPRLAPDDGPLDLGVTSGGRDPWASVCRVLVDVTNTGARPGSEVVQLYLRRPGSTGCRAAQELVAFRRVWLEPGHSTEVVLELDRRSFSHWAVDDGCWRVESGPAELAVGASSRDIRGTATVEVIGDADHLRTPGDDVGAHVASPTAAADLADDDRFERLLGRSLPDLEPSEPFHRNSTFEEVSVTGVGRGLRQGAIRTASRQFGGGGGALDEVTEHLIERAMSEAPLRAMVLFSGGAVSWRMLDSLIATMNGARRLVPGRRRSRAG